MLRRGTRQGVCRGKVQRLGAGARLARVIRARRREGGMRRTPFHRATSGTGCGYSRGGIVFPGVCPAVPQPSLSGAVASRASPRTAPPTPPRAWPCRTGNDRCHSCRPVARRSFLPVAEVLPPLRLRVAQPIASARPSVCPALPRSRRAKVDLVAHPTNAARRGQARRGLDAQRGSRGRQSRSPTPSPFPHILASARRGCLPGADRRLA